MVMYNAIGLLCPVLKNARSLINHWYLFSLMLLFQSCDSHSAEDYYFMPAEFEEQEAVWLGCMDHAGHKQIRSDIIRALLPYVEVKIIANSDTTLNICKEFLKQDHINVNLIGFHVMKDNEFWMRDHGAIFVINRKGQMRVIDFEWPNYGYEEWLLEYYAGNRAQMQRELATMPKDEKGLIDSLMGVLLGLPVIKSWVRIEGGMIEVNGNGTLILNEPLTLRRNHKVTKDSIAKEFERVLGISNIIWLKEGLAEDPQVCQTIVADYIGVGTGGHTDEFVRFANTKTILLAWVSEEEKDLNPINQINYKRMNINYEILKNSKDIDGDKFKIIKIPLPDPIVKRVRINRRDEWDHTLNIPEFMFKPQDGWKHGDTANRVASASYLNYFITNGIILMPTYVDAGSSPEKEKEVKSIFTKVFPDRRIEFINALPLNWRGGGMHCAATPQPKRQILP
jgi:agmatine deiminase